jgi:preprotein translocase subunit SecD
MRPAATRYGKAGLSGLFLGCALFFVGILSIAPASTQPIKLEVASAQLAFDQRTGEPVITFRMTEASRKVFADYTSKNVGRPMAVIVDGKVIMKPVIREPITGGTAQIAGNFTVAEAKTMAERISKGLAIVEIEAE